MSDPSVTAPDPFADLAAELHRVANDISDLIGSGLPKPAQFQLNIQPGAPLSLRDDDVTAAAVDAMAGALLGIPGKVEKMGNGSYFYSTGGNERRGPLTVTIYQGVSTEWALEHDVAAAEAELAEREAELEKARARVAELRSRNADPSGANFSDLADRLNPEARPVPADALVVPLGHAAEATSLVPAPIAVHYETSGWKGKGPGTCGVECACGVTYDNFDSLAEAAELLARHIEAANSPTGLTKAADESRGVLAGTTPVVTYFSFGHGQADPDTRKSLLNHYVTVVAPTYEACREAMFASRFGNRWSFDYLAGTTTATKWIPRWTEHEVIVAPGTNEEFAEAALEAARGLLPAPVVCSCDVDPLECVPHGPSARASSAASARARGGE